MMKIGIIKECKTPPDERVALTPIQIKQISEAHPQLDIVVQRSPIRRIADAEYAQEGVALVDDVNDCDILIGVKEVPKENLIPNKTYFFFSHTIKMQPYNRDLLRKVMEQGITLIDWECLTDEQGNRLIGFGRYAGIVGAYNGFRAFGLKENAFSLKEAHLCRDKEELDAQLRAITLPPMKILLTGRGKVAKGSMETLSALNIRKVSIVEYIDNEFDEPVYAQITFLDYFERKDGGEMQSSHFFEFPEMYQSKFMHFARYTDFLIAGHYWDSEAPFLFTRTDARNEEFRIKLVADISCDIDGPVASTLRPSTISNPFYGYNPETETEVAFDAKDAITVMAVDNLPCELPRDASSDFGSMFTKSVLPHILSADEVGLLNRGSITINGAINETYSYLKEWVAD
jgi:alanine dehydrogenase